MTVESIIASGQLEPLDLNCAEKLLTAANMAWGLGLSENDLHLASAFGGGMGCGRACGALCGAEMALGRLLTRERAHATPELKPAASSLVVRFEGALGSIDCSVLKPKYHREDVGCAEIVLAAARALDAVLSEAKDNA